MSQRYNVIKLTDGKKLHIPSFDYSGLGWQTFDFKNCIPYFDSGAGYSSPLNYNYIGTDYDQGDWGVNNIYYYMGGLASTVKDTATDTHGGIAFFYYYPDTDKYYIKTITKIDSKKYIYVDGVNYLGQNFTDCNTDYPSQKIFYNVRNEANNFLSLTITTDNPSSLSYMLEIDEPTLYSVYPLSLDYSADLNLEYTNYPDEIDPLRFFQDIDLYNKDIMTNYYGLLQAKKYVQAGQYIDQSGIDYYGPPILNLIEQRIYAMEYFAPIIIGDKPILTSYGNQGQPIQDRHFVSDI